MKASLLAVAILATIAISTAVDEECVQRKLRGLPIHWPNPTDCSSFYRCTNKYVKRELLCPAGKEYNAKTGRCANLGKNLCKLSLKAALAGSANPCANEISGTCVANEGSCRSFNICNDNMAYPQSCDAGSYFNTTIGACEPDTKTSCWENLCLTQADGAYMANDNDCQSFYICNKKNAFAQECPIGSYFNKNSTNCIPGECPSDVTTNPTTTETITTDTHTTETYTETHTTATYTETHTTESYTTEVTTEASTEACTDEVTTLSTVVCTDKDTPTTTCIEEITTPTITEVCTDEITSPTTEACTEEVTSPTTELCTEDITTHTTDTCTEVITTPATTCTEITTIAGTEACTDEITTTTCSANPSCDSLKCLNTPEHGAFPALNTNTGFCVCVSGKPVYNECPDESNFNETLGVCVAQDKVCPSKNCLNKPDYTNFPASNTTTGFCLCLNHEATYHECPEPGYTFNTELLICCKPPADDCEVCDSSKCLNQSNYYTFPAANTNKGFCVCLNDIASYHDCPQSGYIYDKELGICVNSPNDDCEEEEEPTTAASVLFKGGYIEGEFVANPDHCMLFYICVDGELVESSCEAGNYFDVVKKNCVIDTNGICPESTEAAAQQESNKRNKRGIEVNTCKEGDIMAHPTDCDKFYLCDCNGTQTIVECGTNNYFNAVAQACQPDINNACWTKDDGNCTCVNGEVSTHEDCDKYTICWDNQQIVHECVQDSYFNPSTLCCEVDTNHVCRPLTVCTCPGGYTEGEMSPSPTDCDKYYVCIGGEQILKECGANNYFNPSTLCCEADTNNTCKPSTECTCPGGYTEGEMSPSPTDCNKYYVCIAGKQVLKECGANNYFNPLTLCCEADTNNTCKPSTECTCPGGYTEGEMSPSPTDCNKYYVCIAGKQVLKECGANNYFNPLTLCCEADTNNNCKPSNECTCPGGYVEGEISPSPTDCNKYYVCSSGQQVLHECGTNNYFNTTSLTCEKDVKNECYVATNCTCPGGYEEGQISPHPKDCYKYYVCSGGKQELKECGINNYFDNITLSCEKDTKFVCWANECADQNNGVVLANPLQCNAYVLCQDHKPIPGVCANGEWFDSSKSSCQPDVNAVCYNPCAQNETISLWPHPDCSKYYMCNGPQTVVGTCPSGGFDPDLGICNPNIICANTLCETKPDGTVFANPKDDTQFYICKSGVPQLIQCPPNHKWNDVVGVCMQLSDPDCDPTPCLKPDSGSYPTLNETENDAFCICRGNVAIKEQCQYGMLFNTAVGVCYSNASCDPTVCPNSDDYTITPNRHDAHSFCFCVSEVAIIVDCPHNGSFNPFTLLCSDVKISAQCNQFECIGKADYYTFNSSNTKNNGFCMCRDHIATFIDCPPDSTYNGNVCLKTDINCDSKQCLGVVNNTRIPSTTNSQGYCECVGGKATYNACPGNGEFDATTLKCKSAACDIQQCAAADDYTSFSASNTTAGFCVCFGKIPKYYNCPAGHVFDGNVCKAPLLNCADSMCAGQPEYTSLPAWATKYGFCFCTGGKAIYEDCPANHVYNKESGVCKLNLEELCGDSTYCNTCLPAGTCSSYAAQNTNDGFCICYGPSVPYFVECPQGHAYDATSGVCLETAQSNCNLCLCADATLENPITSPALNGNTTFCYCSGPDTVMLLPCPAGTNYNDELKLCSKLIEDSCSCPNGILNGDIVADNTTCNKYFECLNGVMHEHTCAAGEYFNANTKRCCADTMGICVDSPPCTCLGAYHEGERIEHPVNSQMYYVCQNSKLLERNCGAGYIFNKALSQCIQVPRINNQHFLQKRSIENDNEFICINNVRRSVPSNCSQYEICLNQTWKRRTCTNFRYYNPEQQKCLEPRDDLVCAYAKLTTLPTCNNAMEHKLVKAKTCQQYYRCQKGKWRLKSCDKQQYFDNKLSTCLAMPDDKFQCETPGNETALVANMTEDTCRHLTVRYYEGNCVMYLMCLDNNWWYQYCPQGMYFNRSLNYCIPDLNRACHQAVLKTQDILETEEFFNVTCLQDGLLRPSAMTCNRYFLCLKGKWQIQHCNPAEFYDVAKAKCSPDTEGECFQLKTDCFTEEKRMVPLNCSAYEQCSKEGKWLNRECPQGEFYDDLLQECTQNEGTCSKHGFKRACKRLEIKAALQNCSMFYYCHEDTWNLGSCLKGFMYSQEVNICVTHSLEHKCKPSVMEATTHLEVHATSELELCKGKSDGVSVAHPSDCTRYYICIQERTSQEMKCSKGSYFETSQAYCRPNDGSCRLPLTGVCKNASDESLVSHANDCQLYYKCSTINGIELLQCPKGEYFHKHSQQCRTDHGECKKDMGQKCFGLAHGTRLAHELYCNIYYACVKGLAIPVECPHNYQFNAILGKCVYDAEHQCQDGQFIDVNITYSCGNLTDGAYLPDRIDCTRYYICTKGQALAKKCSGSAYFDSELLLCVPDDGSCPFVSGDGEQNHPQPPDPIVCEGKHGYLMADRMNCNNFYACLHNKLKHERCYEKQFFNSTLSQCQLKPEIADRNVTVIPAKEANKLQSQQCLDKPISVENLCSELTEGSTIAQQGDCRRYITCQEPGQEPLSQRCRNGESYDSVLGFCRQNDGTCSLENGQRVGECSGKHGQLARAVNSCRNYFMCINGQKISQSCREDEYFNKTQNLCLKDTLQVCRPTPQLEEPMTQSCTGLSESLLYPYIPDNCRSYFQCFKGVADIHKCANDLYFDPIAIKCVKEKTECLMPPQTLKRSPEFAQTFSQLCSNKEFNHPYGNLENNCHSFYFCHNNGKVTHELCPLGMLFNKEFNVCMPEDLVICN